jgi:hypothetical protein
MSGMNLPPALTPQAEAYLEALAKALEIPASRYEQAERSYQSLGSWLHREESTVRLLAPDVFVQGSFRLGTVIRPLSGNEEYDLDCVCSLTKLSKSETTQANLKKLLGDEIKLYRKEKGIAKEVSEHRRCWRLDYADGAQFHMDIVPSIPNSDYQRFLLASQNLEAAFTDTALAITDNKTTEYSIVTPDWPRSNPRGYGEWFKLRMGRAFTREREQIFEEMQSRGITASVEDVPIHRVRTPLQSAIMILKRHRDSMFADNPDDKPISIIISTLAAQAYNNEGTIGQALLSILNRMEVAIEHDGHKHIIRNPTDPLENFADKWEKLPKRAKAFFDWLEQARTDFRAAAGLVEYRTMSRILANRIGQDTADRAVEDAVGPIRPSAHSLLRTPTAASAVTAPSVSFANSPRSPKKPDGFA